MSYGTIGSNRCSSRLEILECVPGETLDDTWSQRINVYGLCGAQTIARTVTVAPKLNLALTQGRRHITTRPCVPYIFAKSF